jgi:YD repeat-containing protein
MRSHGAALVLLALLSVPALGEQSYYRSNPAGMLLERIPAWRRDDFEWTVAVEEAGPLLVRRLMDKGTEVRRWETSGRAAGDRREEKEFASGVLEARRISGTDGTLAVEESFRGGALLERTAFTWSGGRLAQARTAGPDGALLRTDEYLFRRNGSLREVRRSVPPGAAGSAGAGSGDGVRLFWGSTGIAQVRSAAGAALFVTRYDPQGRVTSRERRDAGTVVSREELVYRQGSDALESSTESLPGEGRTVLRLYDEAGRLARETAQGPKGAAERTEYTRDGEGRLTAKTKLGPSGLEEWRYGYTADGGLSVERYSRRGALEKVTTFLGGGRRVEELYAQGEAFLRVTWESGRRVREEVLLAGQVVRERDLQ